MSLWDDIKKAFSPTPAATPVTPCPGSISDADAQKLFDKLKANPKIPFDYPVDCCYARAQEMCDQMTKDGVKCGKVWTYGDLHPTKPDGSPVTFPPAGTPPPASPANPVTWGYHVAPTVKVTHADGSCEDMVMDPSLSDKPLSIAEWNKIMSGKGATISKTKQSGKDVYYQDESGATVMKENPAPVDIGNRDYAFASHRYDRANGLGKPLPPKP